MRRLALLVTLLVAGTAAVALAVGSRAQGSSTSRFDVIFDDARGLVGGQLLKIAGAKAGTIVDVAVTPDFKARIEVSVDSRFMPLHRDATCTIRPEGLIAENYVDCDPGTANSPVLRASGSRPPTVPVANTTEPVGLLDLFNIFNLPTQQRFTEIINELGIGTAGRGDNINDILRRANPALAQARKVIAILARQRAQLATIVDATSTIAAEGAHHPGAVQSFLTRAAALASQTADHSSNLALAVHRLPGLLAQAQPSLSELDVVARQGTPVVSDLHAAVPALNRVSSDLGPFAAAATPALAKLRTALQHAIPSIRDATPLLSTVASYTTRSLPGTKLFARLSSNLQRHGFVENFLSVAYYIATSLSRFDSTSHMLAIMLVGPQNGSCGNYATKPVAGCSAHYGAQPAYTPSHAAADRTPSHAAADGTPPRASATGSSAAAPRSANAAGPTSSSAAAPPGPSSSARALQNLADYLFR